MFKKTILYLWSLRREFAKYFIVGISSLVLDLGTLVLFTEALGLIPWVAVVINQTLILTYNFSLNKYWSFHNRAMPHQQIVRYALLAGWNYIFSVSAMYILNGRFGFDYRLVRLGSIVLMVNWNFFLYKYWVYRDGKPSVARVISEY